MLIQILSFPWNGWIRENDKLGWLVYLSLTLKLSMYNDGSFPYSSSNSAHVTCIQSEGIVNGEKSKGLIYSSCVASNSP